MHVGIVGAIDVGAIEVGGCVGAAVPVVSDRLTAVVFVVEIVEAMDADVGLITDARPSTSGDRVAIEVDSGWTWVVEKVRLLVGSDCLSGLDDQMIVATATDAATPLISHGVTRGKLTDGTLGRSGGRSSKDRKSISFISMNYVPVAHKPRLRTFVCNWLPLGRLRTVEKSV